MKSFNSVRKLGFEALPKVLLSNELPIVFPGLASQWPAVDKTKTPWSDWKSLRNRLIHYHGPEEGLVVPLELGGKTYMDEAFNRQQVSFLSVLDTLIVEEQRINAVHKEDAQLIKWYLAQHELGQTSQLLVQDLELPTILNKYRRTLSGEKSSPTKLALDSATSSKTSKQIRLVDPFQVKKRRMFDDDDADIDILKGEPNQQTLSNPITDMSRTCNRPEDPSPTPGSPSVTLYQNNLWINGHAGSASPCHYDPFHNLLVQIYGTKRVLLFSPEQSAALYPASGTVQKNTSLVKSFDHEAGVHPLPTGSDKNDGSAFTSPFPLYRGAQGWEAILHAGDCLYIPHKWWHYCTTSSASCSVNWWYLVS